jgi:hypothetical protein
MADKGFFVPGSADLAAKVATTPTAERWRMVEGASPLRQSSSLAFQLTGRRWITARNAGATRGAAGP